MRESVLALLAALSVIAGAPCRAAATGCTGTQCGNGGNSPFINKFPINGLRAGEANPDLLVLVPKSLKGGVKNACTGATLTYDPKTESLKGTRRVKKKDPQGHEQEQDEDQCTKYQLEGATFVIASLNTAVGGKDQAAPSDNVNATPLPTVTLTISKVVNVDYKTDANRLGYKITYNGTAACELQTSINVLAQLGITTSNNHANSEKEYDNQGSSEPMFEYAIAVGGPVLNTHSGAPYDLAPTDMFHIACVTDGLAKTHLYNLANDTDVKMASAAVRMITARYANSTSYTLPGTFIDFDESPASPLNALESNEPTSKTAASNAPAPSTPKSNTSKSTASKTSATTPAAPDPVVRRPVLLEALWDEDGVAICLNTPRLRERTDDPRTLPQVVQPPGKIKSATHVWADWESLLRSHISLKKCDKNTSDDDRKRAKLISCILDVKHPNDVRHLVLKHPSRADGASPFVNPSKDAVDNAINSGACSL